MVEPKLCPTALNIVKKRYLVTDLYGRPMETPGQMFWRVAKAISKADVLYDNLNLKKVAQEFFSVMVNLLFLPAGRALFEAGNKGTTGQLSSCFVLPIEDSISSIFQTLGEAAVIQKNNGGTGFNFSKIRPRGDKVKGVPHAASGPVDFLTAYNSALGAILQGAKRRGANIAILNCDHPDILELIKVKDDGTLLANFNLSVGVTNKFMEAVEKGQRWELVNPRNGEVVKTVFAKEVFGEMAASAWKTGDPGIIFLDRLEKDNPTPSLGRLEATNPCGELPLLPYESCNLGSIILPNHLRLDGQDLHTIPGIERRKFRELALAKRGCVSPDGVDWKKLKKTIWTAVHFLDNMIDVNCFPLEKIEKMVKEGNRKIGLGVMGFAHLLFNLGIPYDSQEALELLGKIMKFVKEEAEKASMDLAKKRGIFPNFDISIYKEGKKLRNATLVSVAPTGTISMVANTSSGIEPVFALVSQRRLFYEDKNAKETTFIDPVFEEKIKKLKIKEKSKILIRLAEGESLKKIKEAPKEIREVFVTAHDIPWEYHVRMQAAAQKFADNSISKTINFPVNATVSEIKESFILAWKLGCKGITIYRDKSKKDQVLLRGGQNGRKIEEDEREICPECGERMDFKEGCISCSNCSYSYCKA